MNMPSLSTLHRCGHGTDEMLIATRRGPAVHSSPRRNLAVAQTGEQTSGSGQAPAERKRGMRRESKEKERKMSWVDKNFIRLSKASTLILLRS